MLGSSVLAGSTVNQAGPSGRAAADGVPDQAHWQDCVEPLADVLSFATGKVGSLDGKSIQDYAGRVRAITDNVGIVG